MSDLENQIITNNNVPECEEEEEEDIITYSRTNSDIRFGTGMSIFSVYNPLGLYSMIFNMYFYQFMIILHMKPGKFKNPILVVVGTVITMLIFSYGICVWRLFTTNAYIRQTLTCVINIVFTIKMVITFTFLHSIVKQVPWDEVLENIKEFAGYIFQNATVN